MFRKKANFLVFTQILILVSVLSAHAQLPPVFERGRSYQKEAEVRQYMAPTRIVWESKTGIVNSASLLKQGNGQADLTNNGLCVLTSKKSAKPSIILDFGRELHGGLQLVTGLMNKNSPVKVRLRFGESVSETMSEIDTIKGATNDHAMRDFEIMLPWLGKLEVGNTGFRFVKIDLLDDDTELLLKEVRAIFTYRDIPYLGSFKCNDELLNKIWMTGAYTVHLNMQDYLWDGIKRDRLVWVGDLHPETSTISSVFGNNEVVRKSLDLSRDITPLPNWMNGLSSYSMWWVIIHRDWYYNHGDLSYLKQQKAYLSKLLPLICAKIDSNNSETLDARFLDWPSSENPKGIHAGLQALMVLSLTAGADLCRVLQDRATEKLCIETVRRLKQNVPDINNSKQAAALLTLAGMVSPETANKEVIGIGGAENFSTFYGYYMLKAKAMAGDYKGSLDNIREYWGAMLNLGATTFWEDFNLKWLPNAARIDEIVPPGKVDIHGDFGAYCYKGFRHSLCHGWASGPTPWLTEYVLGVKVIAPGCRVVKISPNLGDLQFVEGTFPTPFGLIKIKHTKMADGKVVSKISAPKEIKILR
jgi:alpha-L-rhamnosidase